MGDMEAKPPTYPTLKHRNQHVAKDQREPLPKSEYAQAKQTANISDSQAS